MKIERISENQIRCTLSNYDLNARNLNLSELAYGSEKARNLFREMIQKASNEVGFEAEDIPLMVEAIPLANESVMLIITKIEDPEELDTRFSKFSPSDDEEDSPWSPLAREFVGGADGLLNLLDDAAAKAGQKAAAPAADETAGPREKALQSMRVYVFDSLDAVCAAAGETGKNYTGRNVLYKNPASGKYYLVLRKEGTDEIAFSRTCNTLSEYGKRVRHDAATEAYYAEHYEIIVKKDALQALCRL